MFLFKIKYSIKTEVKILYTLLNFAFIANLNWKFAYNVDVAMSMEKPKICSHIVDRS